MGVETRPLTGGPPAGFSDDGVLMLAAVGVKKPPTGFGVAAAAGAGDGRLILLGDIMRPPP